MTEVSIRVIGRFRPINGREKEEQAKMGWDDDDVVPFEIKEQRAIEVLPAPKEGRRLPHIFNVDHVLWNCSQMKAFEVIALPTVQDILRGFNGTIFAYGQTSSGKTFSMFGPEVSPEAMMQEGTLEMMGLIPRSCFWLFEQLENHPAIDKYEVKVSALEIYVGNRLRDLIHPATKGLKIRDGVRGVIVQGLQREVVHNVIDVLQYIEIANSHRTVSATKMNATSSRSHSLFTFVVQFTTREGAKKVAKLNFADLAGSEKVGKTGATGLKLQEGAAINQSLTVLGRVIQALAKNTNAPFRESGLTHVLKDSLCGNTKTTLLVCLSPHRFNVVETMATLQFAGRAKMIKNKIKANKVMSMKDLKKALKIRDKKIEDLQRQLRKKLTQVATIEAPEKGLPYLKITFADQAEPTSDSQYIIRRKEIQKEIRQIISKAGLEGVTVETEIRRTGAGAAADPDGVPQINRLPVIGEDSKIADASPLVVHVLFQPSEKYSGDHLLEAKDTFLGEIPMSGGLFATGAIEEGFANPEDYGASLSVSMQRKVLDDLNALQIERDFLTKESEGKTAELKELQEKLKTMELDKMEKEEADMAMERELVQLQDENVSLKASKLVASMRDFGNLLNSPTSSEESFHIGTPPKGRSLNSKPPGLPATINEDEDFDQDDDCDMDDALSMEELEARIQKMASMHTPKSAGARTPRQPRTSFIVGIADSPSPIFQRKDTPASPITSSYQFPVRKVTEKSKLRRTLSVREEFRHIGTDDTFNIQDQSLADMKLVCKQLESESHQSHQKLVQIRTLLKHTVNRMRIVCDELETENQDHEEYVALMKEQLDTRHKELDAAYEDIQLLQGALDKRSTMLEDNTIAIQLDPHYALEPSMRSEQVEEEVQPFEGGDVLSPLPDDTLAPGTPGNLAVQTSSQRATSPSLAVQQSKARRKSWTGLPRKRSKRASFVEVVGLVSKKLEHLRVAGTLHDLTLVDLNSPRAGDTLHERNETLMGDGALWFDDEKEVIDWEVEEVTKWLDEVADGALARYIDLFEESGVTGEALLSFTHHDLVSDFNMDRGHVKLFFKALSEKSEIVKMRMRDQRIRRERKKRKRSHQKNILMSSIIRHDAYDNHIQKLWEKEFGRKQKAVSMNKLYPGDLVDVGNGRKGRIFWKGEIQDKEGTFIGVELHEGIGKNDGTVGKNRYFRTLPGRGVFTKNAYEVIKLEKMSTMSSMSSLIDAPSNVSTSTKKSPSDVDMSSAGSFSGSLMNLHDRQSGGSISESGDDSYDFSYSDSSDDEASETVTFSAGHNRHFSEIPTVKKGIGNNLNLKDLLKGLSDLEIVYE